MSETNTITTMDDAPAGGSDRFRVQPSPHLADPDTTQRLMIDVVIALVPAFIAAVYFFRFSAIRLTALCLVSCLATEYVINLIRKKPNSLGDFSAVITAVILAFSLPPTLPAFATVLGSVFAIAIGKMIFGGLGNNVFNPAMVGRAFLMASFPVLMTTWGLDAVSQATPLAQLKPGEIDRLLPAGFDLFIGRTGGCLGETSALALLIGAAYLLIRRTIDFSIPFGMLGAVVVFSGIAYVAAPSKFANPMLHLGAGALLFGAFFIATDPVSSPLSKKGRWIYGAGCGALTMVIRQFGTYPEGVMFSILLMNALAPLITRWTAAKPLGGTTRG